MRAPSNALHDKLQWLDGKSRQRTEHDAGGGRQQHARCGKRVGLAGQRRGGAAGAAQEGDAGEPDEDGRGNCCRQRKCRTGRGYHEFEQPAGETGACQYRLEQQPLRDESIERWQRGDCHGTDEHGRGGPRHAPCQPTVGIQPPLAGRCHHGAGAHEQGAFHDGVIDRVQERGRKCQRRGGEQALRLERKGETECSEDQADVLDGAEGEHALDVGFEQGSDHAVHRGHGAEHHQQRAQPGSIRPGRREIESEPHESVHGYLGHHATHQRGDMGRRRGVRQRQPRVQREQPGLGTGTDQSEQQGRGARRGAEVRRPHLVEAVAAGRPGHDAEEQQQAQRPAECHGQVHEPRAPVVLVPVLAHDQSPGGQ